MVGMRRVGHSLSLDNLCTVKIVSVDGLDNV
jgi:hypothetical protein